MEPIAIRYHLSEPQFMRACNAHWSAHGQSTNSNLIAGGVGVVLGLTLLFVTFWTALAITALCAILLLITGVRSLLWRRAFRDAKKYNDEISVVIKDDSIEAATAEGRSELNWNFFTWYLDTPEHVLLYSTKRSFSVIPKSAFQTEAEGQRFLELVKSRLKRIR